MKAPPFVLDRGLWRGVLNLIVIEGAPGKRAYGIEMRCDVYGAFEEMIYSISNHGDGTGTYGGNVYIKEAETSNWLTAYRDLHPMNRDARRLLFVGDDFCYEAVGPAEPIVRALANKEAAYAWRPNQDL